MWEYIGQEQRGCSKCGKVKTYEVLQSGIHKALYINGVMTYAFTNRGSEADPRWVAIALKDARLYGAPETYNGH